jgi:hypothetical protein
MRGSNARLTLSPEPSLSNRTSKLPSSGDMATGVLQSDRPDGREETGRSIDLGSGPGKMRRIPHVRRIFCYPGTMPIFIMRDGEHWPYTPPVYQPLKPESRVLVGCEFSGIVRDAFIAKGHHAMSCDLLATERPGPHYRGDIHDVLDNGWDLLIVHPPCTCLCVTGNRTYANSQKRLDALDFIEELLNLKIPRICLENPVGVISTYIRPPTQYIQPWEHGHGETKKTGLWLKGLPSLKPSHIVSGREPRIYNLRDGHKKWPTETWRQRSRFWPGVALAMAEQWG